MTRSAVLAACAAALALPALAAAAPPVPPGPPPPPAPYAAPLPPLLPLPEPPPVPPAPPQTHGMTLLGDHNETITRTDQHGRLVIVARDGQGGAWWSGGGKPPEVLTYRDETGRNVHVYADHPISRADAERIRGEARDAGRLARIEGEKASAAGERARADGERARAAGERARFEADRARIEADRARMEGLAAADAARSEARIVREQVLRDSDGRDYASLGSKDVRVFRRDGEAPEVWIDGEHVPTPPLPPGMARGELRQLREEVRALREQVAQLAADLRRERSAR